MNLHLVDYEIFSTQGAEAWREFNKTRNTYITHPKVGDEIKMLDVIDAYIRGSSSVLPWGPTLGVGSIPQTGGAHPATPVCDRMRSFRGGSRWLYPIYHWDVNGSPCAGGMDNVCFTSRQHCVIAGGGVVESHYWEYNSPQPIDAEKRLLAALALLIHFQPNEVVVTSHYVRTGEDAKRIRIPWERKEALEDLWINRRLELIRETA